MKIYMADRKAYPKEGIAPKGSTRILYLPTRVIKSGPMTGYKAYDIEGVIRAKSRLEPDSPANATVHEGPTLQGAVRTEHNDINFSDESY